MQSRPAAGAVTKGEMNAVAGIQGGQCGSWMDGHFDVGMRKLEMTQARDKPSRGESGMHADRKLASAAEATRPCSRVFHGLGQDA